MQTCDIQDRGRPPPNSSALRIPPELGHRPRGKGNPQWTQILPLRNGGAFGRNLVQFYVSCASEFAFDIFGRGQKKQENVLKAPLCPGWGLCLCHDVPHPPGHGGVTPPTRAPATSPDSPSGPSLRLGPASIAPRTVFGSSPRPGSRPPPPGSLPKPQEQPPLPPLPSG